MREVNFSIPNANKASVHITTTLYDRRALDCTSTLPLINSLNHLAYLTTSSGRIRDILVLDGGVERLVSILKEGRSTDVMGAWKWSLAFQCIVNIGVRGSEEVRTRVVEADMVPVIATILDNYIHVIDRKRAKVETETANRDLARPTSRPRGAQPVRAHSYSSHSLHAATEIRQPTRRQRPPTLDISQPFTDTQHQAGDDAMDTTPSQPTVLTSPPTHTTFPRSQLHHPRRQRQSHDGRTIISRQPNVQPLTTTAASAESVNVAAVPPVRDADRLPSMLPPLQTGSHSRPESPTTPTAPTRTQADSNRRPPRPALRQLRSSSVDSIDALGDESAASGDDGNGPDPEPLTMEVQPEAAMADTHGDGLHDAGAAPLTLAIADDSVPQEVQTETFNINHRNVIDGSMANTNVTTTEGQLTFSPVPPAPPATFPSPAINHQVPSQIWQNTVLTPGMHVVEPRDEDVLMLLQLLAYVSKYCRLRPHFQATHLVPKLRLDWDPQNADTSLDHDPDTGEEYLQPDDYNIFPLVEKFTVRHHSKDMQYWASVVMRNLCRRDENRGGIRQCAYYACGRWEEYTRQFAKCRRCRRTKYCSKDCQKNAWVFHRHWCHSSS